MVISDIVSAHNMVVETLYSVVPERKFSTLACSLPDEPTKILPSEVNNSNCIVGEFTRQVQLLPSC